MLPCPSGWRCGARPGRVCHPTGPSAHLLLRVCADRERQSRRSREQTRKTALLCSVREPTVGAAALTRRGPGAPPLRRCRPAPSRPPPEVCPAAPAGGGVCARGEAALDSAPLLVCALLLTGCSALPCLLMEGAGSPSTGEELELSVLGGQPDEQKPLNGTVQVIPLSVEEPGAAQVRPAGSGGRVGARPERGRGPGPRPARSPSRVSSQLSPHRRRGALVVRAGLFRTEWTRACAPAGAGRGPCDPSGPSVPSSRRGA